MGGQLQGCEPDPGGSGYGLAASCFKTSSTLRRAEFLINSQLALKDSAVWNWLCREGNRPTLLPTIFVAVIVSKGTRTLQNHMFGSLPWIRSTILPLKVTLIF